VQNRYVGLGEKGRPIFLFEPDGKTRFRQVLWGDFLTVDGRVDGGWLKVLWAPNDPVKRKELLIRESETTPTRPLEIVFVDVGQGDGAVVITPERDLSERIVVIDAGEGPNMGSFLDGRFGSYQTGFDFHAAIITHPDSDHYHGFRPIFGDHRIGFQTVYHSGLVERPVTGTFEKLGGLGPKDPTTKLQFLTDLAEDDAHIRAAFGDAARNGNAQFPRTMQAAIENPRIRRFSMLSAEHGTTVGATTYLPDFEPSTDRAYTIEVLGPVVERDAAGAKGLRRLGSYGETKNGHSVLLKLTIGQFRIIFGGDLNERAERFLLSHYAGIGDAGGFPTRDSQAYRDMVTDASRTFRADVLKVCHHGSEKVTDAFIEAVNPAAFIISSGDAEGHVHPRPDLLGRLGKLGRGVAPVLLSTELQRSTREVEDQATVTRLKREVERLAAGPTLERRDAIMQSIEELARTNVDVWGSIYVKTDGQRLITAFKIESGSPLEKWFYFEYAFDAVGQLALVG